jgi:hypothetical protein
MRQRTADPEAVQQGAGFCKRNHIKKYRFIDMFLAIAFGMPICCAVSPSSTTHAHALPQ